MYLYRVFAVVGGALALAACSSSSDFMDSLKPAPLMDTVRLESEPPGAEAKAANGQSCRTPCALALPTAAPMTVTFTLNGYQTATETLELMQQTGAAPTFAPNPVAVELAVAPPPPKKPPARKPAPRKPAPKPAAGAAAPAPAPAAQQQGSSPWPTAPAR